MKTDYALLAEQGSLPNSVAIEPQIQHKDRGPQGKAKPKKPPERSKALILLEKYMKPLGLKEGVLEGWRIEHVSNSGNVTKYYYSPVGERFHSRVEVAR